MPNNLTISLSSENLAIGSAEERTTFGLFAITANNRLLTEGVDTDRQELRHGPYVSGYPLAEWFAMELVADQVGVSDILPTRKLRTAGTLPIGCQPLAMAMHGQV